MPFQLTVPYVVNLGSTPVSFSNAYCNLSSVLSQVGLLTVTMNIWDSSNSAMANSGIYPIGSEVFQVATTPALANVVVQMLSATSPTAAAFFANTTYAP